MSHAADARAEQWSRLGLAEALRWAVPLKAAVRRLAGAPLAPAGRRPYRRHVRPAEVDDPGPDEGDAA